ncbi:CmcI family methyltransferase [Oceanibacterium hippocampi]|uniref:Rhamnosyl O-methyltransferase n=1 Tax=Oceanibacterium hippocampi TaxID=745714 RepID=A0A1Y5TG30_9PROT|nr:CmcI family methyltransferase [Oceanibacterium hippocampi]SLN63184.1 Rhamnosyl O-methyltransferase precursor [Oceanibacterium hippocampi]
MKFTIFGAGGFIGRRLSDTLKASGHEVATPDRTWLSGARNSDFKVAPYNADLGQVIYCIGMTADFREKKRETVDAHVSLLNTILHSTKFESFLYLSTTRVYLGCETTSEAARLSVDPQAADDLYNLSKIMGESACLSLDNPKIRVARVSNVAGFDPNSQNFLNSVIRTAVTSDALTLGESLESAKNYVYVDDVVEALINIATRAKGRIYNVAGPDNVSHGDIAAALGRLTGVKTTVADKAPTRIFPPIDMGRYSAEFPPITRSLNDVIDDVVNSYRGYHHALDPASRGETTIDEARGIVRYRDEARGIALELPMESAEGWEVASKAWLRVGWDVKHIYTFTWMGRPIIQLPEDMIRIQELIHTTRPDVIIETGIAHGGSLIYYASLFEAMGHGRVIGVDIQIRPHNRRAIEEHPLFKRIEMFEGSSTSQAIVDQVKARIGKDDKVMLILDSNHTKDHVLAELRAYAPLVTVGCYAVAADGIMAQVAGGPRTGADWPVSNPTEAARAYVAENEDFVIDMPAFEFNESPLRHHVTYWPDGYLRRVKDSAAG